MRVTRCDCPNSRRRLYLRIGTHMFVVATKWHDKIWAPSSRKIDRYKHWISHVRLDS